jgi:hypothetical protein
MDPLSAAFADRMLKTLPILLIVAAAGMLAGCQTPAHITVEGNGKVLFNGWPANDSRELANVLFRSPPANGIAEINVVDPQGTTCGQLLPILVACQKSGHSAALLNKRFLSIADVSDVLKEPWPPDEDGLYFPNPRMGSREQLASNSGRCINDLPAEFCPTTTTRVSLLLSMVDELLSKGFHCGLGAMTLTKKAQWAEVFVYRGKEKYNLGFWSDGVRPLVMCYILDGRVVNVAGERFLRGLKMLPTAMMILFRVGITNGGDGIESAPGLEYISPESIKRTDEMVNSFKGTTASDMRVQAERTFSALSQRDVYDARVHIICAGGNETADVAALRDAISRFRKSKRIKVYVYSCGEPGSERRKILDQIAKENNGVFRVVLASSQPSSQSQPSTR